MYSPLAYFLVKQISELPIVLFNALAFCLIVYFPLGLVLTVQAFINFFILILLVIFAAMALGANLSITYKRPESAFVLANLYAYPMVILGGMLTNNSSLLVWFGWL